MKLLIQNFLSIDMLIQTDNPPTPEKEQHFYELLIKNIKWVLARKQA